jgi:hypothetical protein
MSLQQHPTIKGLWQSAGNAIVGAHALLIGVSEYPHLEYPPNEQRRGKKANDTGTMGQLAVSALSAARVFDWVKTAPSFAGLPIKSCRLHLSPRPSEQAAVNAITNGWYGDADLETLQKATKQWGNALPNRAGGEVRNVALFYYSGHGVEHAVRPALFASDILNPDDNTGSANALSFKALPESVSTYGVSNAFFFIDACRNAPELAKRLHIVGTDVLQPADEPGPAPEALIWLHATRLGDFAYQLEGAEATFYGQSLVEGLASVQPDHRPYDRSSSPWKLWFKDLEAYMKNRVRDLLSQHDKKVAQVLIPGGDPYQGEALVAELPVARETGIDVRSFGPAPGGDPTTPLGGVRASGIRVPSAGLGSPGIGGPDFIAPDFGAPDVGISAFGQGFQTSLTTEGILESRRASQTFAHGHAELSNFTIMHGIFKHEHVTIPWTNSIKVLDAATGQPLAAGEVQLAHGSTRETLGRTQAFIDVTVSPGEGRAVWIQVGGGESPFHAVVVPRDLHGRIPLRLDVTLEGEEKTLYRITSMSARLGPPDRLPWEEERRVWKRIWQAQRAELFADVGSVTRVLQGGGVAHEHIDTFEIALKEKMQSPVAAAIGAAYLLQAGATDQMHDWPRNLSNWFPWLSEGPVLWAETLLRRDRSRRSVPDPEALNFFLQTAERGPPLLGPVFQLAAHQLEMFTRAKVPGDAGRLQTVRTAIEEMANYMSPGGLFTTFVSNDPAFSRERAIGTWAKIRHARMNAPAVVIESTSVIKADVKSETRSRLKAKSTPQQRKPTLEA